MNIYEKLMATVLLLAAVTKLLTAASGAAVLESVEPVLGLSYSWVYLLVELSRCRGG